MPVTAKLNYLRISPRKVRLVADLIKGLDVIDAETQLKFLPKRASSPVLKLLNSAVANAKHNFGIEKENLYIQKIIVNTGPTLKRWRPRSRGMAVPIKKRTSHIELILEEKKVKKIGEVKKIKRERRGKMAETPEVKKEKRAKRPSIRPQKEIYKPKIEGAVRRIFRRKAF